MINVDKSFFYTTPSGHRQYVGRGQYSRLPDGAIEAGRAAKAIRDTTESKRASRRTRKG